MIIEYPETQDFILEVKEALDVVNILPEITQILIRNLKKRLLIPGVLTINILNQYINIIKVFQILDPLGQQYETINQPIKTYLFGRPNFMRCLIQILRDESDGYENMQTEKLKIPALQAQGGNDIEEESSEEEEEKDDMVE